MKYLAILFILFPMVVMADGFISCKDIPHLATCRTKCLSNEYELKEMKAMTGKHKDKIIHTFCTIVSADQVADLRKKGITLMKGNEIADYKDMGTGEICCTKK